MVTNICQSLMRIIAEEDVISLAHLLASLLKRWLLGTHQGAIDHKNLPYYLDEFTFRFNRRTSVPEESYFIA